MKAGEILRIVEDEFHRHYFIIDAIVSDNESIMKYMRKQPEIGAWGQVMIPSKVKIDKEIQL